MNNSGDCVISVTPPPAQGLSTEMCEHKGIGHPDSLCDGAVEAASRALCRAYLDAYGAIRPFNLDKALLVGGQSAPKFGGGRLLQPMRLIVSGPATSLPSQPAERVVGQAIHDYLSTTLGIASGVVVVEPIVRASAPNLQRVIGSAKGALANDTSFGVGYAPFSRLEKLVLLAAEILRGSALQAAIPAVGKDYKVMGSRVGDRLHLVIALALVDRHVKSAADYFALKADISAFLDKRLGHCCTIEINALDDRNAHDESGVYLTVTGLSAEHGDDGEVGRGNRVNGLITPYRPMSLEAAAGKNPVSHVGKLYNLLAHQLARDILADVEGLDEVTVRLLSAIGRPVDQPQLVAVDVVAADGLADAQRRRIEEAVARGLAGLPVLTQRLIDGSIAVF